jgi:hypothetical protein
MAIEVAQEILGSVQRRTFILSLWPLHYLGLNWHNCNHRYDMTFTDFLLSRLPVCWDTSLRKLAVLPATMANTPHVFMNISHEMVEVCTLYSEKGIAIVLLNWSGQTINSFSFTTNPVHRSSKVSSARQGTPENRTITITSEPLSPRLFTPLKITLSPLEYVEVLMIKYP